MTTNIGILGILSATLALFGELATGFTPAVTAASLPKIRIAADGRSFVTEGGRPFTPLGVTYFRPDTGWAPQVWKRFDPEVTRSDFARMKELGINCVRVFLTYGSFLTETNALAQDGLRKLDRYLELAEETGIYVHPTGPDHWEGLPAWAKSDQFADDQILNALEFFWTQFAARYRGRPVIFAYDLRNEPEVPWDTPPLRAKWNRWLASKYGTPEALDRSWGVIDQSLGFEQAPPPAAVNRAGSRELLDYQQFREAIADEWTRRQSAAIKAADPEALVTVGFIQWSIPALLPRVGHYAAFRPTRQAAFLDFLEVHFYPLADGFYDYVKPIQETRNLAYLESVVREVALPGKPVVLAEFGWYGGGKLTIDQGKHPPATEEQQARWCRQAIETTVPFAVGWLNWGFYDTPDARDVSQLVGLVTAEGRLKAWGQEFQRLSRSWSHPGVRPLVQFDRPTLDWDLCVTSTEEGTKFRERYFEPFRNRQ